MKKTIATLCFCWGMAGAQATVPCRSNALFKIQDAIFYGSILDTTASAYIYVPAKFPNPASVEEIEKPFKMSCANFKAVSTKGTFTLSGNVQNNFKRLISYWRQHDPDTTNYIPGRVDLGFYGAFYYPNIREDWFQERLMLEMVNGKLVLDYADHNEYLKDLVVGYRINGGVLKPAFFDLKLNQIKHGNRDIIEIYVKGEHAQLSYLKVDLKNQIVTIKHNTAFPSK